MKKMLSKVSNTSLMFTNHGGEKDVVNGLNNNSSGFPFKRNSIVKWTSDSIGQAEDVMVYARGINHEQDNITSIIGTDLTWR